MDNLTDAMRRELRCIHKWGEPSDLAEFGARAIAFHARDRVLGALLRRGLIEATEDGFALTDAGRAAITNASAA